MSELPTSLKHTQRLLGIMQALRDPDNGCPWDRKQTFETIVPHTLEEAYEVADAIESGDMAELEGELGDLLFQVVFYAQLGQEQQLFDFESIAQVMSDKLIRRHPHVFSDKKLETDADIKKNWERLKQQERQAKNSENTSLLDDLPKSFPALSLAQKMQKRVGRHGFDWPEIDGVIEKLEEEIAELKEAIASNDQPHIEEEMGDLLFSCVNLSRHLKVDPEAALRASCRKFESRFRALELIIAESDLSVDSATLDQLESAWQKAKSRGS
ncbi:nucleoside triphosphate pyrophosphohydrolase [Kangiella sediminilitoris]|uniref:Nucleoside triphosphate pyrophosphohydrolase n=1 Tax=Kangiella sediminilitoris TaxID=1144748 RepID=A0A1B3BBS7_9GAMM|nr:nucleoside triphosphate pyrophosphohydrolase [Kangiella sediminilitoris]AOE50244.1 MazG family protein [Kangiella sediminilitoris]